MNKVISERGNVSLELALGFSLFVSLLTPVILEYSVITKTSREIENYLSVLGRGWSLANLEDAEETLLSLKSALSKEKSLQMRYSCDPACYEPDGKLTIRLIMPLDSLFVPKIAAKGTFARDFFSR
ncbi:MAG: hypothetical protein ACO3P3_02005 [Candidatus Nanopelagicales bacterium]